MGKPFYKSMEAILFTDISYFSHDETEHLKDIIFCFETYGAFLNKIPIDQRESIVRQIFHWVEGFWLNGYITREKKMRNPLKPIEKMNKHTTTIRNMIELFESEHIGQSFIKRKNISSLTYPRPTKEEQFYKFLIEMEKDLVDKQFKIFDKRSFYMGNKTTKEELVKYLFFIIEKYNILKAKRKIKELVDCIPEPTF